MPRFPSRPALFPLLAIPVLCVFLYFEGCATALGPGYAIEKQGIRVRFVATPEPRIVAQTDYQLRNTGNQPLSSLELRLADPRRFRLDAYHADWDGAVLSPETSPSNPRNSLLTFPHPWLVSARHTLHLSVEIAHAGAEDGALGFTSDAFFLPAQGWSPELLPARGLFATGGVPPKTWNLVVRVPQEFRVRTSGREMKSSRRGGELTIRAAQRPADLHPFVIAGRYSEARLSRDKHKIYLWTRAPRDSTALRRDTDALDRSIHEYDSVFGARQNDSNAVWIVECPAAPGCFTSRNSMDARMLGEENEPLSAELISLDSIVVDLGSGKLDLATSAAPSLAASWLGYSQNPGFIQQEPPLSQFPAFAAALGLAAVEGPATRTEIIRSALRLVPENPPLRKTEDAAVVQVKSLLFFFALQDRYGQEAFHNAIGHMLYARRERGFNLSDLIAAFEQETHQNVAEFVRAWMKHPGVPADFRARYADATAVKPPAFQETSP